MGKHWSVTDRKKIPLTVRFHSGYTVNTKTQCWEWHKTLGTRGYGAVTIDGRRRGAHIASWVLHKGGVPDGMCVLHRCDNRKCVNPEHLFIGTKTDNNLDRDLKGRTAKATRHGKYIHGKYVGQPRRNRCKTKGEVAI